MGLYLGDRHITRGRRDVFALSLFCSDDWPGLLSAARSTMSAVMPASGVCCVQRPGCTQVKSTSKYWPCLFPQDGPGRKHTREIGLEQWQSAIVERYPGEFARDFSIRTAGAASTGCGASLPAVISGMITRRYLFDNKSADILRLCGEALDRLGVAWGFSRPYTISVAQRAAVARLDEFVGPKY
jgi:hypothetical protein